MLMIRLGVLESRVVSFIALITRLFGPNREALLHSLGSIKYPYQR